jgi:hypothetical protein
MAAISCPVTMKPEAISSIARPAITTIGTFFGKNGVLETIAREITRTSDGTAPRLSREVTSRYRAR